MSRLSLIIAAIAATLMAGCAPLGRPDPNPQPDHGPPNEFTVAPEVVDPSEIDYHVLLDVDRDPQGAHYFEDRWADCSVIGYGTDGRVVTVKDSKTGIKMPFQMFFEDLRIPFEDIYDLPIVNREGAAHKIEVVCTVLIYAGDAAMLEVTMNDLNRIAPLLGSVEISEAPRDMDPERFFAAIVSASIIAGT